MAKRGENFVVYDAKIGDDITRSVLGHIIAEQEKKAGQDLFAYRFYASADWLLRRRHARHRADLS